MEDLQQQIDRTKCILNNYDSGDLLLLNYMASRLYLLRELTSRDYDDFFTARAQYSSWCKEQQQLYIQITENSLNNQKVYLDIAKIAQNTTFEQTKQFLTDITRPSDAYGTQDEINKLNIQFKVHQKLSFDDLSHDGEKVIDKYSELSFPSSNPIPLSIPNLTKISSKSPEKQTDDENLNQEINDKSPSQVQSQHESNSLSPRLLDSPSDSISNIDIPTSPISTEIIVPENKLPISLTEYKQDLTGSLNQYEQIVCNTMERFSELALQGIRKKFANLKDTEGIFIQSFNNLNFISIIFCRFTSLCC